MDDMHIKSPLKSECLAEFIGIMLGDGCSYKCKAHWQVRIVCHSSEIEYVRYVAQLIEKLFNITPTIKQTKHANA